ncbi:glycosyltransferase family 4 protein [Mucilaginibacter ginkgonis]|uniref:Glycosyltransferase family 4 protein n=1 Tax=Mucilaginibacter ginkgonis TaxID=2682091 RepID=A0A6I4I2H4_9SPHI|nr:glycosyltransferase family 1 protein [Mucilaginibacter ginkgonis]QQL49183.1 glycosyltransferase family 4 protein [Mucilaginibacter ginkgonis]
MKPKVLVTFDSMKDINRGYYSFGKGLGDALIKQNNGRFDLAYYLFKKTPTLFNNLVKIVYRWFADQIFFRKRNDFDVVHFSDQRCRLPPWNVNAKKVITIHDLNKVHLKKSKPHRIIAYLNKLNKRVSHCDRVVTISQFVANDVERYLPAAKGKISVIHNGAEKLQVKPSHQPNFIPDRPYLFTIGLMSPQKGFHYLPALLNGNDYGLVIAGIETTHKAVILEEAAKYNCTDRVHLVGEISNDDKAWYYAHCLALVFPSRTEGFGLPVIEAMHLGKPAFLSKFTSLPEIGGDAAYYFDSFDPAHMQKVFSDGMKHFKENNGAEKSMAQAAKFSWEKCADAYLNLYNELLGK